MSLLSETNSWMLFESPSCSERKLMEYIPKYGSEGGRSILYIKGCTPCYFTCYNQ